MSDDARKPSLSDEDITTDRKVGRRGALVGLGTTLAGAAALATGCGGGARTVVVQSSVTDSDSGYRADPQGGGRGTTGVTDRDAGECSDPANYGVSGSGLTDSDAAQCADTAGNGRRGS